MLAVCFWSYPAHAVSYQITATSNVGDLTGFVMTFDDLSNDGLLSSIAEVTSFSGFIAAGSPFDTVGAVPTIAGIANGPNFLPGVNTWLFSGPISGPELFGPGDWSYAIAEVSTSATPLPGALPLFATGLGALGLFGWRRKRKALAA